MPALPLHGNSFRNGVRFSVQTGSRGSVPCKRCRRDNVLFEKSPVGSKDMTGRMVRVESMKLRDAQKRPESAFVRVVQRALALFIQDLHQLGFYIHV